MANLKNPFANFTFMQGCAGRDAELKYSASGTPFAKFPMAHTYWDRAQGGTEKKTLWVDVTCFGKTAEIVGQSVRKGTHVQVQGKIRMETWADKNTGAERNKIALLADRVDTMEWPDDGQHAAAPQGGYNQPPAQNYAPGSGYANAGPPQGFYQAPYQPPQAPAPAGGGWENEPEPEDDIPF